MAELARFVAMGTAAAPLAALVAFPLFACASMAMAPGDAEATCVPGWPFAAWILAPLFAAGVVGAIMRRPGLCLGSAVLVLGLVGVMVFSAVFVLPLAVAQTAAAAWYALRSGTPTTPRTAVLCFSAVAAALGFVGLAGAGATLSDPCHSFGQGGSAVAEEGSVTVSPSQGCPDVSGTSQSRAAFVAQALALPGAAVAASGLSLWGAWRNRPAWLWAGAAVFAAQGVAVALLLHPIVALLPLGGAALAAWAAVGARRLPSAPAAPPAVWPAPPSGAPPSAEGRTEGP